MDAITLNVGGKPMALRWTNRSDLRLGSLDRPPQMRDLSSKNPRRGYYALLAFVWASLVDREEFAEPESLADHIHTDEQQEAAWNALRRAFVEAGIFTDEKKAAPSGEPTGSQAGHSQSSSSGLPVPTTTT